MPSQKNINQVQILKDKLEKAKSVILADHSGLNVSDQTKLRAEVSQAGGEFTIAKNTLLKLALKDKLGGLSRGVKDALREPTAILFSYEDAIAALKALTKFCQEHDLPKIKLGLLDDRVLSLEEIQTLAKLPTKNELFAKLISQIQAPCYGLATVLGGNLRQLVLTLTAIKNKKPAS